MSGEVWPQYLSGLIEEAWPLCLSGLMEEVWPQCLSGLMEEAWPQCLAVLREEAWPQLVDADHTVSGGDMLACILYKPPSRFNNMGH